MTSASDVRISLKFSDCVLVVDTLRERQKLLEDHAASINWKGVTDAEVKTREASEVKAKRLAYIIERIEG